MTGVSWISCGLRKGVLLLSHLLNESPRSWNLGGAPHPGMTVGNSESSQLWAQEVLGKDCVILLVAVGSFCSWPEGTWEPGFQLGETGQRAT